MKKLSFFIMSLVVVFFSCNKEDEPNQIEISSEEAAVLIATSLGEDQGGLQSIFTDAITVVNDVSSANSGGRVAACGASDNTTFSYESQPGETPSFAYSYDYGWTLVCGNDSQPSMVNLSLSYDGTMNSPDFLFSFEGNSGFDVTDILQEIVTINGTHNQEVSYDIRSEGQQFNGNNTFAYTLTDIKVDAASSSVQSGTAAVLLAGVTNRGVYAINATIVYNGDGSATVTINGDVYGIDLSTGTITG